MKLLIILLVVLIFIKPVEAYLFWEQPQSSIPSGSKYFPQVNYSFQINWISNESISNVFFESNFSGTIENLTVSNVSENTYAISFLDLPAGNYYYKWYANDSLNNWNFTETFLYIINKNNSAEIKLYLNGTESNKSYNLNSVANFTALLSIPNKTIFLNSTYPGFEEQNGSLITYYVNLSSPGLFKVTAYWEGDENYTGSSKSFYFDNIPPQYFNVFANPNSPTVYYANTIYAFSINWMDATLSQVLFESNHTGSFKNYTINESTFHISGLPAETFVYRWIAFDSINNVNSTNQNTYYILKRAPLVLEITPSRSVVNGTKTTVICYSVTNEVTASNFKLFRNSVLIENNSLTSRKDEQILDVGSYIYVCNSTETQNFTNQTISLTLNVTLNLTPVVGNLSLIAPSLIELNLGEQKEEIFYLENNLGYTLSNITFSISGVPKDWYNISELPLSIPNNFSLTIKVKFSIPIDAEVKDYNLSLFATGKIPNETKLVSKSVTLKVKKIEEQNFPPVYSESLTNKLASGYEFALKWRDDAELSGYIFSSNITGEWLNDSWIPLTGKEGYSYVYKNLTIKSGVIAWKFYANDSNNLWTESEEFYLKIEEEKGDITLPIIIVSIFVVALASILLFINQKRSKHKASKKENVIYVYRKEDLK